MASFLWGSLGRGDGDDLSDIDLWVVIRDEALYSFLNTSNGLVAWRQRPLFVMEAPYNGPVGGTCLHTLFDGEATGAHQVDWYIQPLSSARILPCTKVLFDNIGLPQTSVSDYRRGADRELSECEGKVQQVRFFWLMLGVCGKYAYRSPNEERMGLLTYPVDCLNDVKRFLGEPVGLSAEEMPVQLTIDSKLRLLQDLAQQMEVRMLLLEERANAASCEWNIDPATALSIRRFLMWA